jgi:hypothetical protein
MRKKSDTSMLEIGDEKYSNNFCPIGRAYDQLSQILGVGRSRL